jgi:hypothetical protein
MKLLALLLLFAGCTESEGRFPVVIVTTSDDGRPFPDVIVTLGKAVAGKTGADGKLSVNVRGKEGMKVAVSVDAPKGYKLASPNPSSLVLRRLTDMDTGGGKGRVLPVEHTIKFSPLQRQYAVLVRVGVPGLDVETFGTRQAVTNSKGVAMFLYSGAPGDELQVKVNTTNHPDLRPQNPSASFLLGQRSEAYVVKEKFNVFKAPVKKHKPVHIGPKRL